MTKEEFFNSVDWLSVSPYRLGIDAFCKYLDDNDICFTKRVMFDNKYVVINRDNGSFVKFLSLFDSDDFLRNHCHISRFDVKFDFVWKYSELLDQFIDDFKFSNTISDSDKDIGTVYFNSRGSDTFCRLYDKQKELNIDSPLSRLEYEIKGLTAMSFSLTWTHLGFERAFDYLMGNLTQYNVKHGIDSLMPEIKYCPSKPVSLSTDVELKNQLSFFINHSKNTFRKFVNIFGTDKLLEFLSYPDNFEYLWNLYYKE